MEKFSLSNLDGIQFLAVVGEHVVGGGLGDVQDGFEGHLSLSSEVGLGQRQIAVLRDGLVKLIVFIISYIIASESEKKIHFLLTINASVFVKFAFPNKNFSQSKCLMYM